MSVLKKIGDTESVSISIKIPKSDKTMLDDLKKQAKELGYEIDIQQPARKAIQSTIAKAKREIGKLVSS